MARTRSAACVIENLESRQMLAGVTAGFVDGIYADGLTRATQMAFVPDGRLLVAEQGGKIRVIKDGLLLPSPAIALTVNKAGERGLSGIVADPQFTSNGHLYVFYTRYAGSTPHNRVSRLTMSGDTIDPASERVVLDLEPVISYYHMGGALKFGDDGKLYVSVGDNARGTPAQKLDTTFGKILRINPDGSIPADNPFYDSTTGMNRAIFSLGLRNPFTFAVQPGTQTLFINDVGENTWEEVNRGGAGANFGWPNTEGPTSNPAFVSPLYAWDHSDGGHAAIGADFYPWGGTFPQVYHGKYIFGDHVSGWIKALDPQTGAIVGTISTKGIEALTDIDIGPDGALYYLERTYERPSRVGRIQWSASQNAAPVINQHPQDAAVAAGKPAAFTVKAGGQQPLRYQWQRDGVDIDGATASSYTIASPTLADDNARFGVIVSNDLGTVVSHAARLSVASANTPPAPTIDLPTGDNRYTAGQVIAFSGRAIDAEDGTLTADALTWRIDFHHDTHLHPFISSFSGESAGEFVVPVDGELSANVWFRINLTATDSHGNSVSTYRDVFPQKSAVTIATSVPGLSVTVDSQPRSGPYTFQGVVDFPRQVAVQPTQVLNGVAYDFSGWSDGVLSAARTIITPASNSTFTAVYTARRPAPVSLEPTADTYVRGGTWANTNFGKSGQLNVKTTGNKEFHREALLKFDLSGFTSFSSAILRVWGRLSSPGETVQIGVYAALSSDWSESGVTWNSRPQTTSAPIATATVRSTKGHTKELDVTAYLLSRRAAGDKFVTLALRALPSVGPYVTFNSSQKGLYRPSLDLL